MKPLIACILAAAAVVAIAAAAGKQTFTGTISDDICAKAGHAQMRMGPTDGECTIACVDVHGASYVLVDGDNIYVLSDQQTPEKFANIVQIGFEYDKSNSSIKSKSEYLDSNNTSSQFADDDSASESDQDDASFFSS